MNGHIMTLGENPGRKRIPRRTTLPATLEPAKEKPTAKGRHLQRVEARAACNPVLRCSHRARRITLPEGRSVFASLFLVYFAPCRLTGTPALPLKTQQSLAIDVEESVGTEIFSA